MARSLGKICCPEKEWDLKSSKRLPRGIRKRRSAETNSFPTPQIRIPRERPYRIEQGFLSRLEKASWIGLPRDREDAVTTPGVALIRQSPRHRMRRAVRPYAHPEPFPRNGAPPSSRTARASTARAQDVNAEPDRSIRVPKTCGVDERRTVARQVDGASSLRRRINA